jgi:hypothetical protein
VLKQVVHIVTTRVQVNSVALEMFISTLSTPLDVGIVKRLLAHMFHLTLLK